MAIPMTVPRKKCSKGHVIPLNGEHDQLSGKILKNPQLACAICGVEAGGVMSMPSLPLKRGQKPEGQESFLEGAPSIRIK